MRKIKFRAWDGTFMINPYCDLREHNQFWGEDLTNTPYKSPISVMQFTEACDKHGKEIYEGDLILVLDRDWPSGTGDRYVYMRSIASICEVVFHNGCFQL